MQSVLVITNASQPSDRLDLVSTHAPEPINKNSSNHFVLSEPETIGIDTIRQIKSFLATQPSGGDYKIISISYGEHLTRQSQNALLKILEEPPQFARIFICVGNSHQLLPTIRSRCHHITTTSESISPPPPDFLTQISPTTGVGDRLVLSDQFNSSRDKALQVTTESIHHFRHLLKQNPNAQNLHNLKLALFTAKLLKQNINPKLALDQLFMKLK